MLLSIPPVFAALGGGEIVVHVQSNVGEGALPTSRQGPKPRPASHRLGFRPCDGGGLGRRFCQLL